MLAGDLIVIGIFALLPLSIVGWTIHGLWWMRDKDYDAFQGCFVRRDEFTQGK